MALRAQNEQGEPLNSTPIAAASPSSENVTTNTMPSAPIPSPLPSGQAGPTEPRLYTLTEADNSGEILVSKPAPVTFSNVAEPEAPIPSGREMEEGDDFPEDYEDYYPRGLIDEAMQSTTSQGQVSIENKREDTRGRLAIIYTVATFSMFFLGFVAALLDAWLRGSSIVDNLSTILPLISGIFLGSLGFVLGYYFRKAEAEGN